MNRYDETLASKISFLLQKIVYFLSKEIEIMDRITFLLFGCACFFRPVCTHLSTSVRLCFFIMILFIS